MMGDPGAAWLLNLITRGDHAATMEQWYEMLGGRVVPDDGVRVRARGGARA